jgi:hypothetical protein
MAGLAKTFETLDEDLIGTLVTFLDPLELVRLGATCKRLRELFNRQEVWEQYVSTTVFALLFTMRTMVSTLLQVSGGSKD